MSTKKNAAKAGAAVPAMFGEAAAKVLAMQCLSMVRNSVRLLQGQINREAEDGKPWGEAEVELDAVVHLLALGLKQLHESRLTNLAEFETTWWRLTNVLNMCCRAHADKESALYSFLHAAALEMESLPNLWDHVIGVAEEGELYGNE